MTKTHNYVLMLLLTLFLGPFGIHRFYVGKTGTGVLYLLTFGIFGIGWIVDVFKAAVGSFGGASIPTPRSATVPAEANRDFDNLVRAIDDDVEAQARSGHQQSPDKRKVAHRGGARQASLGPIRNDLTSWVAVDIEWADSSNATSICEIGLARFEGEKLLDKWNSYVRPSGDFHVGHYEFDTHGISKDILTLAPSLADLWPDVDEFVGEYPWVLHNATQDVKKILATLGSQGHPGPREFQYVDTMLLAKKLPHITSSNSLDALSGFLGLTRKFAIYDQRDEVESAHGALEDAILTGEVLNRMMALVSYSSLPAFLGLMDAIPGEVRDGQVTAGFSAAGKFKYPNPDQIPSEAELTRKVEKALVNTRRATTRREDAEVARDEFLKNPEWSEMRVTAGTRVCFTQLMPWDDNREFGFQEDVERASKRLGLVEQGVNNNLELLIVNDPWVSESAKLRDCLAKEIPVTTYSIFQKNNPEFPVWNYKKADQYRWLKSQGDWPA